MAGLGSLPLAPKLLKGFSLYFYDGRMKVCATRRGPNAPPLCLLLLFLCCLSLFQEVLLVRIDFLHKGRPCTVSRYEIKP